MARNLEPLRDTAIADASTAELVIDRDGDGYSDAAEAAAGSDADDAASTPAQLRPDLVDVAVAPTRPTIDPAFEQTVHVDVTKAGEDLGIDLKAIDQLTDLDGKSLVGADTLKDALDELGIKTQSIGDTSTDLDDIDAALGLGDPSSVGLGAIAGSGQPLNGGFGSDEVASTGGQLKTAGEEASSGDGSKAGSGGTQTTGSGELPPGVHNPNDMSLYSQSAYTDKYGNTKASDLQGLFGGGGADKSGPSAKDQIEGMKDKLSGASPEAKAFEAWKAKTAPGDTPAGDKPAGDKPAGDKPAGDKPAGDKPAGDKPAGDKPAGDKPADGGQAAGAGAGAKPAGSTDGGTKPADGTTYVDPDAAGTIALGPITQEAVDHAMVRAGGGVSTPVQDGQEPIDESGFDPGDPHHMGEVSLTTGDDAFTALSIGDNLVVPGAELKDHVGPDPDELGPPSGGDAAGDDDDWQ